VRLDRYYSYLSYVDKFEGAESLCNPRENPEKNATLRGSWKWKDTMEEFVRDTLSYTGQYYLRNNSDARFLGR